MGGTCTKPTNVQTREDARSVVSTSIPHVTTGRAEEPNSVFSLPAGKSTQSTPTTCKKSTRHECYPTTSAEIDTRCRPAKIARAKRSPLKKLFGIFKKKRTKEAAIFYRGDEEGCSTEDETRNTAQFSEGISETAAAITEDESSESNKTSSVTKDTAREADSQSNRERDSVLSFSPPSSGHGDEIVGRNIKLRHSPMMAEIALEKMSHQDSIVSCGMKVESTETTVFKSASITTPNAIMQITSTSSLTPLGTPTLVASSMQLMHLTPSRKLREQRTLMPGLNQEPLLPSPSQKAPVVHKNEWKKHMLNVQFQYNGRTFSHVEKQWLENQINGLVNVLLKYGKIPENLSVVDLITNHLKSRGNDRKPGKLTLPIADIDTTDIQMETTDAKDNDHKQDNVLQGRRDVKIKSIIPSDELNRKFSDESIDPPSLLTSVSSMNTFITAKEGPANKEVQHDMGSNQIDTHGSVPSSPTLQGLNESRVSVTVTDVEDHSPIVENFTSKLYTMDGVDSQCSVDKVGNTKTGTAPASPKENHFMTESAIRTDSDHRPAEPSLFGTRNHDRIMRSLIEEAAEQPTSKTNTDFHTDAYMPGRDFVKQKNEHIDSYMSEIKDVDSADCVGLDSPIASARPMSSHRTAFQKVGSSVTKPIALRSKAETLTASSPTTEISSITDQSAKTDEPQKLAPEKRAGKPMKLTVKPSLRQFTSSVEDTRRMNAAKSQRGVPSSGNIFPQSSILLTEQENSIDVPMISMKNKEVVAFHVKKHHLHNKKAFVPVGQPNRHPAVSVASKRTAGNKLRRQPGTTDVPGHFKADKVTRKFRSESAPKAIPPVFICNDKKNSSKDGRSEENLERKLAQKPGKRHDKHESLSRKPRHSDAKPSAMGDIIATSINRRLASPPMKNGSDANGGRSAWKAMPSQYHDTAKRVTTLPQRESDLSDRGTEVCAFTPRNRFHHGANKTEQHGSSQTLTQRNNEMPFSPIASPRHMNATLEEAIPSSATPSSETNRLELSNASGFQLDLLRKGGTGAIQPKSNELQFQLRTCQNNGMNFTAFETGGIPTGGNAASMAPYTMYAPQPHPLLNNGHVGQFNHDMRHPASISDPRFGGGAAQCWTPSGLQPPYGSPFFYPARMGIPGCHSAAADDVARDMPLQYFPYLPQSGPAFASAFSCFPQYPLSPQLQGPSTSGQLEVMNNARTGRATTVASDLGNAESGQYPRTPNLTDHNDGCNLNGRNHTKSTDLGDNSRLQSDVEQSSTSSKTHPLQKSSSSNKSRRWRQCEREKDEGEAWWMPKDWAKERGIGAFKNKCPLEKERIEKKEKELEIAKDANVEQIRTSRFVSW